MPELSGVLTVNKPFGVTSHDVVNRIRRLYHTRRVGHTGTLDPMATGVLVILIGRAAKASEYLSADRKTYRARLRLGLATDSEDITGKVLSQAESLPDFSALEDLLPRFRGKILQTPPMYSALKVNGQKLVDLARKGITVERRAREIEIFSLEAEPTERADEVSLTVTCSGGTYIRTLCADIGSALGCGGCMAALERTETGGFPIEGAHTLEELEDLSDEARAGLLLDTESLFADLSVLTLPPFFEHLCRSGCEIYLKKLKPQPALSCGDRVRLSGERCGFFALGEVGEYDGGLAVKAIKTFFPLDQKDAKE
ncbi:MAG: tRNA pseudouridine(55) synthase TruB [Clostridia bacterium]|nr:tRNA pseudouridine(55) synthase TruB [Clostridia bacterium]